MWAKTVQGSAGGSSGSGYESGTFTTQTSDFDVPLTDGRKPKMLVLVKKTATYGIIAIYDEAVSDSTYKYCYSHQGTYYDAFTTGNLSAAVAAGRGGLKSVSEGKFSFYAVSQSGYTGDYQYWAAY